MVYLTISQISALSEEQLTEYKNNLCSEYHLSEPAIKAILEEIKENPHCATPFILNYLVVFYKENMPRVSWLIFSDDIKIVEDDVKILWWKVDDNLSYIFLNRSQYDTFTQTMVDLDTVPESSNLPTLENFIKNNYTEYLSNATYLSRIHVTTDNQQILPINPPVEEVESSSRFSSAVWFDKMKEERVLIAGLGGIGSWTALLIARTQPYHIELYDNDIVDYSNLGGQFYEMQDIKNRKTYALAANINNFSNYNAIISHFSRYTSTDPKAKVMICGFDNMESREVFFYAWLHHISTMSEDDRKDCLFIDGRMAAEYFQVFCIRGDDTYNIERYEKEFLFSSSEAEETICSYKQTSYISNMIGSVISNLFVNFVANKVEDGLRELPFLTTYSADSLTLKTEN